MLQSKRVKDAIQKMATAEVPTEALEAEAMRMIKGVAANFNKKQIQTAWYFSHKLYRSKFDQIIINDR